MRTCSTGFGVLLFASCVEPNDNAPTDDTEPAIVCDAPMGPWEIVDLPAGREGMGIVSTGSHVYVVGGWTPDGATDEVWIGTQDGDGIAWADAPKLPAAIEHSAVGIAGGRLWFLGGDNPDGVSSEVFSAEVDGDEVGAWEIGLPLDEPKSWAGSVTVGDHVFVFGGTPDFGGGPTGDVLRLDAGDDGAYSIVSQTPLPEGRFATSATTADNMVYVVGGATSFYDSANTVWRAPVDNDTIGEWEELAVLDDTLIVPGLTVTGDTLLVAGGASDWSNEEQRVWQISLTDGTVKKAPRLPEPRLGQGSVRLGDRWVQVGGWSDLSGVMHDTAAVTTVCPG